MGSTSTLLERPQAPMPAIHTRQMAERRLRARIRAQQRRLGVKPPIELAGVSRPVLHEILDRYRSLISLPVTAGSQNVPGSHAHGPTRSRAWRRVSDADRVVALERLMGLQHCELRQEDQLPDRLAILEGRWLKFIQADAPNPARARAEVADSPYYDVLNK